jgi:hypothetical protein
VAEVAGLRVISRTLRVRAGGSCTRGTPWERQPAAVGHDRPDLIVLAGGATWGRRSTAAVGAAQLR